MDGENGFLVFVRDMKILSGRMECFICNQKAIREMGECSRKMAEGKYDVHKVNGDIIQAMDLS